MTRTLTATRARVSQRASALEAAHSLKEAQLEKKASVSKLQEVVVQATARALEEGRAAKETAATLGAKLAAKELELGTNPSPSPT